MNSQLAINDHPIVRIHNNLITANFGHMELNSMRIFLIMLSKLKWDVQELHPIRLKPSEVIMNYDGGTKFQLILKAIDELKSKMKDVKMIWGEEGKKIYKRMTVIDSIEYREESGDIIADFGKSIRPYLIELKGNFTQAELKELLKLTSTYSIRFFLIVKSLYRQDQVFKCSVQELRQILLGDDNKYPQYKEFKKFVLTPNCRALQNSSAAFEFVEEKKGRNVAFIEIKPLKSNKALKLPNTFLTTELHDTLEKLNVNTSKILQMVDNGSLTEDYIKYVIKVKLSDKKVTNIAGAIYDAVVYKYLIEDFNSLNKKQFRKTSNGKTTYKPTPVPTNEPSKYTTITMDEAKIMYQVAKDTGKTKYPISGFIKGLKTGKNILVEGYSY